MSKKESLENKVVTLYMAGGWEFTGRIEKADDNKFIVESEGRLIMAFKDKISCLIISEEDRAFSDSNDADSYKPPKPRRVQASDEPPDESRFPMNRLSYDETAMSIPGNLLGESAGRLEDELSVFFPGGAKIVDASGNSSSNLSFEVEGEENDPEE